MKFKILSHYEHEDGDRYYIDGVQVGSTNYDEHGSSGMEASGDLFKEIARVLKAEFELEEVGEFPED